MTPGHALPGRMMSSRSIEYAAYVPDLILRRRDLTPAPAGEGDRFPAVALFADIAESTRMANELAKLGRLVGPEEMCRVLNAYYGPLISQLRRRGGDVIGFAGDAVLAVWPAAGGDYGPAVRQATEAALEIQQDLNNLELAKGVRLSLRIYVGAGELSAALVGGPAGFWQLVTSGPPLDQIRAAGTKRTGEVFLSREAVAALGPADLDARPGGGAFVRRLEAPPPPPAAAGRPDAGALPEGPLRLYVPRAVRESIDAGLSEFLDQSRTVTTLFARITLVLGTTEKWERTQTAMTVLQQTAERYGGTVVQLMEDDKGLVAVLAFGVPPVAHEDDPARAIDAAVDLLDRAAEYEVGCGVGVSTGLPFCGSLGSPVRRVYTVIGPDVIRAARLMHAARDGEILCDQDTHAAARKATRHAFAPLPRHVLKGFESPVRVYLVSRAGGAVRPRAAAKQEREGPAGEGAALRAARERLRAAELDERLVAHLRDATGGDPAGIGPECDRLLAAERLVIDHGVCRLVDAPASPAAWPAADAAGPMIDRGTERGVIARSLDAVAAGQSRVVLVEGEPGVGKSRLLEEARAMAADRAMLTLAGYCSAVEAATPYHPWRGVFDGLLGLPELTDPVARGGRVLLALRRNPAVADLAPLLNDVLGLSLPEGELLRQITGRTRAENVHDVLAGLLAAAADGRPTLIELHDAQWADSASWQLARIVRDRVGRVAVAVSVRKPAALPAEYDALGAAGRADRIALAPLSEADAGELARLRLGAERMSDPLARLVWRRTQGNPLFIETVVDHLVAAALVELTGGTAGLRAAAEADAEPAVPDSIRGLITARIDRLPPPLQLTAKLASVIGPRFPEAAFAAVHPDAAGGGSPAQRLEALAQERVLRQIRPAPDAVYEFPHPVIQQVCYELLPRTHRTRLHATAAAWFEADPAAGGPPLYRLVAHHWGLAGVRDKQAEFLSRASESAARDGAYREAAAGFAELLQLSRDRFGASPPADERERRAHWEYQLGQSHFGLGDLPVAADHLRVSLGLRGYPLRKSKAGLLLDTAVQVARQFGRRVLQRWLRPPAALAVPGEVPATYNRLGRICYYTNDVLPGINATLRGLNSAEAAGPSADLAIAYGSVMIATGVLNWHGAARVYARLAEATARRVGLVQNQAVILSYLSMYHLTRGEWDETRTLAAESLELAERIGDHQQCGEAATILAMLACFVADYQSAERWAARITDAAARSRNAMHAGWAMNIQAEADLRLGRTPQAFARLDASARLLAGNRDRTEEIRILGMRAGLTARAGDLKTAGETAARAEAVVRAASRATASTLEGFAGIAEARFAVAEADRQNPAAVAAARAARRSLWGYARLYPIGRPRAAAYEGRWRHLRGSPSRAVRAWRAGLEAAVRLRMPFETALLHELLGRHLPPGAPERREHLAAAADGYNQIGMEFEAERVRLGGA